MEAQRPRRAITIPAVLAAVAGAALATAQTARAAAPVSVPSSSAIRQMLATRVASVSGADGGVCIVVGVIGPQRRRIVAYGHPRPGDARSADGGTAFEIGSVTKVFTALVLADMVQRREVALADPVAKYLPGLQLPRRGGESITLLDLATHTSGLPLMADDLPPFDDPAAATYSAAQLRQFLSRYTLPREIGSEWEYSNIGYWLLSQALAARAAMDYETLLQTRVLRPLRLADTAVTLSPKVKAKLALGHDAVLQPAPSVSTIPMFAVMPAAGGLVSTADDLLRFLSFVMGDEHSPLEPAMALMLSTRRPISPRTQQALGWVAVGTGDDTLFIHDGGTLGHASSVAWDPKRRVGVVVLSNQTTGVGDLARHLLRPSVPLETPKASRRQEIAVDPEILDGYVGRYEAAGEGVFVIARANGFLTMQLPASWGLPRLRLRPESLRDFFATELPLRVTFQGEGRGRASRLLVYPPRGQAPVPANRTDPGR